MNIKGLASGMLAKSVNDAGWSSFIDKLFYKAAEAGRALVKGVLPIPTELSSADGV